MLDNLNKAPRNKQEQPHGLWVEYKVEKWNYEPALWWKGFYINGVDLGYWFECGNEEIYYAR